MRPIVEARVEGAADIRQRADQWTAADGWPIANLEVLADGGVRLKATAGAATGPTTVTSAATFYRAFETGVVAPYIDPLTDQGAVAAGRTFAVLDAQWATAGKDSNIAYGSAQAWLHPRFDTTKPKYVRTWALTIYKVGIGVASFGLPALFHLIPFLTVTARADAEAAGWVVFTFQDATGKIAPFHPDPYAKAGGGIPLIGGSVLTNEYVFAVSGVDAKGLAATNVGWGYDNVNQTFVGGGAHDPALSGWVLVPNNNTNTGNGFFSLQGVTGLTGIPAFQLIPHTYAASATIPFKTGTPIDLLSTPASAPELVGRAEVPLGTSVTFQAAVDPAGAYTTFKDGQTTADISLATQRKYDMQAILTASPAGDLTPIVRGLGARVVTKVDLGDVAEVVSWSEQTDPITHKGEVEECTIRILHDGERDYRDAISQLLSQNAPAKFYFRVYMGDRALPKDQWLHLDDFFPDDEMLAQAYVDLPCVSSLSLLRQALPVLKSDQVAVPTADSANPGVWTASTGTLLYPQIADVAPDLSAGVPDDTTYIQSVVNPVTADYIATLGAIAQPQQTVGATIQFRAATAAGGQSLTCTVYLREGTTIRATKSVTVNVADTGQGSYTPFQYLLTVAEQAAITNWGNLNFRIAANGTGQIRVGWARLVVLGLRSPLVYPSSATPGNTPQTCMDDLIKNQIALDARYQGPKYTDTSPVLPVAKTIATQPTSSTDLTKAKNELDALAWIAGWTFYSSAGRVACAPLYQVTAGTDLITGTTTATFAGLVGPIRAILPREEIEPISVTAGWRQRLPLFAVSWGWNGQNYAGEAQVSNAPALAFYGQSLIDPETRCPTETAQWISGDGLGRALATRHGQSFGLGMMVWRFRTTYMHPELERGDVIVLATDQFLAYDPIANRAIAGRQWATGVIVGRYDVLGREWAVWIQSLAAIRPVSSALAVPSINPQHPLSLGVSGYVGEAAGTTAGDNLNVFWAGAPAVAAVKIAVGTTVQAAGTGTLYVGNQGVATVVGPFAFGTTQYVTVTPYATVDGSGAAGVAAVVVKTIDGSSISTPYNQQGSIPPMPVDFAFSYNANSGTNNGAIAWTWPAGAIYRPDGTTITVPASSSLSAPAAPTLTQVAGGALGARTRFVRIGYYKALGLKRVIYNVSAESSLAVLANNLLKVTAPASVAGYDGWVVLVGSATNTEFTQGGPQPAGLVFGSDWTEPTIGATVVDGSVTTPFATTWVGAVVYCQMTTSNTFRFYVYWDLAFAAVQPNVIGMIMNSVAPTAANDFLASQAQQSDGHIPLAATISAATIGAPVVGYITATAAAASATGSGAGLGGRF